MTAHGKCASQSSMNCSMQWHRVHMTVQTIYGLQHTAHLTAQGAAAQDRASDHPMDIERGVRNCQGDLLKPACSWDRFGADVHWDGKVQSEAGSGKSSQPQNSHITPCRYHHPPP
eukprot:scaffold251988_cov23-Tisochrysis_lutea.AAC.2